MAETPRHLFPSLWHPRPSICSTPFGLAENFCSPSSFCLPWNSLGTMACGSHSRGSWEPQGAVGLSAQVRGLKAQGWVTFEVASDAQSHPSVANICKEDHTLLFSFVIHSPHPHVKTQCYATVRALSFSWHNHGFASIFDISHRTTVLKDRERKNGYSGLNPLFHLLLPFLTL